MPALQTAAARFLMEEKAVSSIEYALLAVLIGIASMGVLTQLSGQVHNLYTVICAAVTSAVSGSAGC